MSDEEQIETEVEESTTRMLTAEYKDGKLQIVEVSPYQKGTKLETQEIEAQGSESEDGQYMQVLDGDKNVVVDLLNLTLVRCGDGEQSYRLVGHGDDTVTCVLAEDDEQEDQESYVFVEGDSEQGPLVFLQSDLRTEPKQQKPAMSPTEILERAKALQKAKCLMSRPTAPRRRSALPPPHELLSSPGFKLFLYSCKLCSFKCNAIKDLTKHKASEHGSGAGKWRGRAAASSLQCARCPYRANTHSQGQSSWGWVAGSLPEILSTPCSAVTVTATHVRNSGAAGDWGPGTIGARHLIRHVKDRHLDSSSDY